MASGGYPGQYETGKKIEGIDAARTLPDVAVFHAGTRREAGNVLTNGGRVLGVTAAGASLEKALGKAYRAVEKIHFEGAHYRTNIGAKGIGKWRAAEVTRG
jgi:phosphoribosylamine--glycine ligase